MQNISPAIMHGTTIELQCARGHRSWLSLETKTLACVCCGSPGERTGRMTLSTQAGRELCGTGTSPRLRTIPEKAAEVETYTLHVTIPTLSKFSLD